MEKEIVTEQRTQKSRYLFLRLAESEKVWKKSRSAAEVGKR